MIVQIETGHSVFTQFHRIEGIMFVMLFICPSVFGLFVRKIPKCTYLGNQYSIMIFPKESAIKAILTTFQEGVRMI
ncbi:hypothetical protein D3C76_233620 [compost metagenome]